MKDTPKDIPTFESEEEEREFWATHDSTEYVDWDKASPIYLPKLKPSTKSILEAAYQQMAQDEARESLALEWAEATSGDVGDEAW